VFPWRGVLRAPVTIGSTVLLAGELVRVSGKDSGTFTISAWPLSRDLTGTAPASAVDEPVCASIERGLLGNLNLRWGQDQAGWRGFGRANQVLELREDSDSEPVTVAQDEVVTISRSGSTGTYAVTKAGQFGFVPVGSISPVLTRPPLTSALQLMCFEMPPFAADLSGLGPGFMRTANQVTCFGTGPAASTLDYWAGAQGAVFSSPQIVSGQFATVQLQRGDLVQFYSSQHGYMHTAVATGDGQDVYSLWNMPVDYPVRVTLSTLYNLAERNHMTPVYVRTATPDWHRA
jgi:hypothetical protein